MVGPGANLYNLAHVTLHHGANLSQGVHLCAGSHDITRWTMPLDARPIVVGENAWLAAEVFVGPGVTIGELAVIGARSVVMRDQPPRMVCAGNPCHPRRPRPDPS
jgi:putative colanic acid biosynthesis acetyltransferase WcaF